MYGVLFFFVGLTFFDHSRVYYITPDSRRCRDCCKVLFRKLLIMSISMFNSSIYSHSIVGIVYYRLQLFARQKSHLEKRVCVDKDRRILRQIISQYVQRNIINCVCTPHFSRKEIYNNTLWKQRSIK